MGRLFGGGGPLGGGGPPLSVGGAEVGGGTDGGGTLPAGIKGSTASRPPWRICTAVLGSRILITT